VAAAIGWWLGRATGTRAHAGTVALIALVGAQLGQTLALGRHSPLVVAASLASFTALAIIVQTPGPSHFFGCRPLGPVGWTFGLGAAAAATATSAIATPLLRSNAPAIPAA
jgi:cation-transporting ATPase I